MPPASCWPRTLKCVLVRAVREAARSRELALQTHVKRGYRVP